MKFINYIIILLSLISQLFADQSLLYKEGRHLPLIFLIDIDGNELPVYPEASIAITENLDLGLHEQISAILVTQDILYNYLYRRKFRNNPDFAAVSNHWMTTDFSNETWELHRIDGLEYFTANSYLYLLIPKKINHLYKNAFNFKIMNRISLPSKGNPDYSELIDLLKEKDGPVKEVEPIESKTLFRDLEKIFITIPPQNKTNLSLPIHRKEFWEVPMWDIYLYGHGHVEPEVFIAGLSPEELEEILIFLNDKLRVGVLILGSCYAGGTNLASIKFKYDLNNDKILSLLNFLVVINSVGDMPVTSFKSLHVKAIDESYFQRLFSIVQNLGVNEQNSLKALAHILNRLPTALDIHGQSEIPQIILPGGIEIQVLTSDNSVKVLGNVKIYVSELENKPIDLYPKKTNNPYFEYLLNVLVYPQMINVPLLVRSSHLENQKLHLSLWEFLPSFSDLVTKNEKILRGKISSRSNIEKLKEYYLYPNLISMIHGDAAHYFSKMVFEGNAFDGSGGVLMGLRDSFCDIVKRPTTKNFYIGTIEGPNDISLILKAVRALSNDLKEKNPLENHLPQDGEKMVLRNVAVETVFKEGIMLSLKFQINNTAWEYIYDESQWRNAEKRKLFKPKLWNFVQINAIEHENNFKKISKEIISDSKIVRSIEQKPLASVLKEKISKISINKTKLLDENRQALALLNMQLLSLAR